MPRIKAILFDVDGVLYDSMPYHVKSWIKAFSKYNIHVASRWVYLAEGMKDLNAAKFMLTKVSKKISVKTLNEIVENKIRLFDEYRKPKIFRRSKQLIRYLNKRGVETIFVTGSFQKKTLAALKQDFGVPRDKIITGKDIKRGKPHPDPYRKAMKRLGIRPEEAIVIENAPLGIKSAVRAGVRCIALQTGMIGKKALLGYGAKTVLQDCVELSKFLKKTYSI